MADLKFEIHKTLFEADAGKELFRICVISWNGGKKNLDFRKWYNQDGEWKPGKGASCDPENSSAIAAAFAAAPKL